jgi:6-pyruvoyltetrahydropterin/6-carboxytetrahydropterin synthase
MPTIRITKEFNFEMAHALYGYDGACKNIHGHSYHLSVTIIGQPITDLNNPKRGMVMDFTDLKKIMKPIIEELDHATILDKSSPYLLLAKGNPLFQKLVIVNYQPTCENLLGDIAKKLLKQLPERVLLHHLKLRETSTSFAEWYREDNLEL